MRTKLASLALLFALFASFLGVVCIATPVFSYSSGKIAFRSQTAEGFNEIFIMNADGSSRTQLTHDSVSDREPCLSPDGSKIVYSSDVNGNFEIWKMNSDGTSQTRLTDSSSYSYGLGDGRPSWSPDGTKIVFESSRNVWNYLYIMNADGSGLIKVNLPVSRDYQWPSFSPDGTKLLFYSNYDNKISTSNLDGSGVVPIPTSGSPYHPVWSPDGSKIVFYSSWPYPIYTIDVDGSHQTNIGNGGDPTWSPDGNFIAYVSSGICIMEAAGTNPVSISSNPYDQEPSWGAGSVSVPSATITIVKNTLTVTDTFGFTGTGGNGLPVSFTISPSTPKTFSGGGATAPGYTGSQTYVVTPGIYSITESDLPADWSLYSSVDQYGVETLGEPTVTVTVAADDAVTIEFYNSKAGEPGFPLPELPTITLLGIGLITIGVFVFIKRQISNRQHA